MKPAYYNEFDENAAQWLRNLIAAGHIAPGDVDERSIEDVTPDDLKPYTQCHFFAGIGVWSYALRLAGWDDDREVWTGSCPCQPFSAAGKGEGFADERHLWPAFHHLIRQRRPASVLGEQVASKDADPWIDLVQADLEALGYAFGAVPFPAASVGAPEIRDRLYWVADADDARPQGRRGVLERAAECSARSGGVVGRLADADRTGRFAWQRHDQAAGYRYPVTAARGDDRHESARPTNGHWRDADWLFCRDGKWRPVEPGTFPLAHGAAARVGRLRAYGNAIVAQCAEEFIRAYLETKC